jgi:hypothetical protein
VLLKRTESVFDLCRVVAARDPFKSTCDPFIP